MMFDCQPRITYERQGRAHRYNGENVPYSVSIGLGVFSPRRSKPPSLWKVLATIANVCCICPVAALSWPTQAILHFSTLDKQAAIRKMDVFPLPSYC